MITHAWVAYITSTKKCGRTGPICQSGTEDWDEKQGLPGKDIELDGAQSPIRGFPCTRRQPSYSKTWRRQDAG